jgi:5-oxoprolinase (ATP-hydrolysing) subunit C
MTAALETLTVVTPGFHTLLVDQGRPRTRSLGVPVGGAADRRALALGNALVGNEADAAALEINLAGPTLCSSGHVAAVVLGDAEFKSDRRQLFSGMTCTLEPGETLRMGSIKGGMRAYFCVRGGFQTPIILGSRSTLRPLAAGDELTCVAGMIRARFFRHRFQGEDKPQLLRTIDGTQVDWFRLDEFYRQEFRVRAESNRMGLRLAGQPLGTSGAVTMISEPVCPGTVQVTPDGQCIVLGVDGQTIGGYPKIAQVITADLDKLAQLRPGTKIRFDRIELAQAETIYHAQQEELHEWLTRLRTVARSD